MAHNKILTNNGERLGIRHPSTIRQADAFLRILSTKPVASTVSDVAKVVLCLDLAATSLGASFDKETAIKLTGLRNSVYQNKLNNIEKILHLDKPKTVSEVCVQFSCVEAKELAEKILESYQKSDAKVLDISHPQYVAAAVYISCKDMYRLNGIKINTSQIKLVSRLKTAQWNELVKELDSFSSSLAFTKVKKRNKEKVLEEEEVVKEFEDFDQRKQRIKDTEEATEEYEVWKERILQEASAEILHNEMNEDSS